MSYLTGCLSVLREKRNYFLGDLSEKFVLIVRIKSFKSTAKEINHKCSYTQRAAKRNNDEIGGSWLVRKKSSEKLPDYVTC